MTAICSVSPAAAFLPAPSGGVLGPLVLACLGGPVIGLGISLAGYGLLAAVLAAWLSAIVLTVALPAALLFLRRAPASAAELEAWQAASGGTR